MDSLKAAAGRIERDKGNVAVFLGAGASKSFGWPLTAEILPEILLSLIDEDRWLFDHSDINSSRQDRDDRAVLRRAIGRLCPGISWRLRWVEKNFQQLPLVTSILSLIDYAVATEQAVLPEMTQDDHRRVRRLLERAIYEVIEYPASRDDQGYWSPRHPGRDALRFVRWLDGLRRGADATAIVTTNYDVAIERAWESRARGVNRSSIRDTDYGFDWLRPVNGRELKVARPRRPARRIYKLHGSTNWLRCALCERMYINPDVDIAAYAYEREVVDNNRCHCGHAKLEVQIVAPSFVRSSPGMALSRVWDAALDWLRASADWIIIGYSFPPEDLNIRALLMRAFASHRAAPRITVIQKSEDAATRARYEMFFPPNRLCYLTGGLSSFLDAADA